LNFSKNVQTHFEKCCQNYLVEFSNMENKSQVSGKTLPQIHRKLLTILLMHKQNQRNRILIEQAKTFFSNLFQSEGKFVFGCFLQL